MEQIGIKFQHRMIRLRISDTCNFNCSYCSEHNTLPNDKVINSKNLELLLLNLEKLYNLENRFQDLFIWGGEPTLNPELLNFLKKIRNEFNFIKNIEIHSNLSLNYSEIFIDTVKQLDVKFSSSFHLEYPSKKVFENFKSFNKNKLLNEINLMWHNLEEFDKVKNIKKLNKELPFSIIPTFQLLDKNFNKVKILLKSSGDFEDKSIPTSDGNKNYIEIYNYQMKGMLCNIPIDSFIINTNGDIYFCQNFFLENKKSGINIFNDFTVLELQRLTNVTRCIFKNCDCEHIILKQNRNT